jgi:hypothetical protein
MKGSFKLQKLSNTILAQGGVTPNSYNYPKRCHQVCFIPTAATKLLWRTVATPKFLLHLAAASQFIMPPKRYHRILGLPSLVTTLLWRKTPLSIFTYSVLPLATN